MAPPASLHIRGLGYGTKGMMFRLLILVLTLLIGGGCEPRNTDIVVSKESRNRIVSLDFCADQYVLKFAERSNILALSPYATEEISYLSDQAVGIPTVPPIAENVLALRPNLVVRSYGGGPNITNFLERAGIDVIQIGWVSKLAGNERGSVINQTQKISTQLGNRELGLKIVEDYALSLAKIDKQRNTKEALYVTPSGFTTGKGTLINEMIAVAGYENYERRNGWRSLPLERLAYTYPDIVVTSFFEFLQQESQSWSSVRHPIIENLVQERKQIALHSSWVSCGGWFIIDAVKALSDSSD